MWFAFDEDDPIGKIQAWRTDSGRRIATARRLLATGGAAPDWIAERAAPMCYRNRCSISPIRSASCTRILPHWPHPLQSCRVHPDDERALATRHGDPVFKGPPHFRHNMALREQFIALGGWPRASDIHPTPTSPRLRQLVACQFLSWSRNITEKHTPCRAGPRPAHPARAIFAPLPEKPTQTGRETGRVSRTAIFARRATLKIERGDL